MSLIDSWRSGADNFSQMEVELISAILKNLMIFYYSMIMKLTSQLTMLIQSQLPFQLDHTTTDWIVLCFLIYVQYTISVFLVKYIAKQFKLFINVIIVVSGVLFVYLAYIGSLDMQLIKTFFDSFLLFTKGLIDIGYKHLNSSSWIQSY